ncbi:hypothetical protein FNU77_08565 [Prescottella equi]|uniref:hypothetical protein n=1 Tax=Rhodococcus hoagii TaxID=43767 RepID=UPI0011647137|nr:hypothetical protein [Prescottella equi]QDP09764.1 hypothetical protein FNU77_08565 [Prescottella equi]
MTSVGAPTDISAQTPTRAGKTAAAPTTTLAQAAELKLPQLNSPWLASPDLARTLDFPMLLAAVVAADDRFEASNDAQSDRDVDTAIDDVIEAADSAPLPRWFIGQAPAFDWTEGSCRRIYWRTVGSVEVVGDDVVTPEGVVRHPATISLNGCTDELDTNAVQQLIADLQTAVQIVNETASDGCIVADGGTITRTSEVE